VKRKGIPSRVRDAYYGPGAAAAATTPKAGGPTASRAPRACCAPRPLAVGCRGALTAALPCVAGWERGEASSDYPGRVAGRAAGQGSETFAAFAAFELWKIIALGERVGGKRDVLPVAVLPAAEAGLPGLAASPLCLQFALCPLCCTQALGARSFGRLRRAVLRPSLWVRIAKREALVSVALSRQAPRDAMREQEQAVPVVRRSRKTLVLILVP
jgi:hypothetical protein